MKPPAETPLLTVLSTRLAMWIAREAPRVRGDVGYASIKFTIEQPQGDDDGLLYLNARVEEKAYKDELGGSVPGVKGP